jgi:hypothetical protein
MANRQPTRQSDQPQSRQINPGENLLLSVSATSTNQLFYQWQFNGTDIPSATDTTLSIPDAGSNHVGRYWVRIWDERTWVWSDLVAVQMAGSFPLRLNVRNEPDGVRVSLPNLGTRKGAIEVSPDLLQWNELMSTDQIEAGSLLDSSSGQRTMRFFRLRLD